MWSYNITCFDCVSLVNTVVSSNFIELTAINTLVKEDVVTSNNCAFVV